MKNIILGLLILIVLGGVACYAKNVIGGFNMSDDLNDLTITKIKEPSVAGTFYTDNKEALEKQISEFKKNSKNTYNYPTRAVIVPHAGLVYSGRIAYEGISQIDKDVKTIFVFAPAHRVPFTGLALTSYDEWKTPLGTIKINREITKELESKFGAKVNDKALAPEHSVEIEVPIIQSVFKDVKIVPVLVGNAKPDEVYKIISHYYGDKNNAFVISSDLSHYLPDATARRVDAYTAQHIETANAEDFTHELACGATGILGLMQYAKDKQYSLIRIDMTNSGETSYDKSHVVGYGTWFLYEGSRNDFIKDNYSDFILDICRKAISDKSFTVSKTIYPQVFSEPGASFVTLEKEKRLRGCIGSIIPQRALIDDIVANARNAAFNDPRFNPVEKKEIKDLSIAVSLLSIPEKMSFKDEQDLLNQIRKDIDGIIIRDGRYQAVYLPSVWEQLPDKKEFLNSLKIKAGMSPDHFSKTFEAYRFVTSYIK